MVFRRAIALIIGLAVPLVGMQIIGAPAQAAELKVLSSTALKAVLEELAPQFEKATEVKVVLTIAASAVLKARIDQGAAFDVAVLAAGVIVYRSGNSDFRIASNMSPSPTVQVH